MALNKQFVANSQPVSDNDLCRFEDDSQIDENINEQTSEVVSVKGIQEHIFNTINNTYTETTMEDEANTISGTSINQNVSTVDVVDILSQINAANDELTAKQEEEYKEAERQQALAQEKLIEERKKELLKDRVIEEENVRKEQEKYEQQLEEEQRLQEQKKRDNLKGKVTNVFSGFVKRDNGSKDNDFQDEQTPVRKSDVIMESNENVSENKKSSFKKKTQKDTTDWEYIATHDALTGLLNASAYDMDIITAPLNVGIIFVDANNLKYLNDTYGHESGDKLLSMIAKILLRYFDGEAYRIGGDEFVIITKRSEDKVKKIINNMKSALERQTKLDKSGMIYSVAIGYAYGDGKTPLTEIRAKADELMYADKKAYKESHPLLDKRKETIKNDKTLIDLAYTDTLTGLKNKHAFDCTENMPVLTLIQVVGFDDMSRASGDKFVELIGKCMNTESKTTEDCYYIGNGEFCVLSEYTPDVFISTLKAKLHSISIDISSQIMTGAETNEKNLILAREVIATPKEKPKSYNERLSLAQRQMKETVKINHEPVVEEDVADMMDIIQQKCNEIIMIFMASSDFNDLFIFLDSEEFLQVAWDMGASMDYSYIYAVYPGGALYYGADDYYSEITDLFQRIAENLSGRDIKSKEISRIEGINIFEHIYIK